MQEGILSITGQVQHYKWGGFSFIPDLLSVSNEDQEPFAELWFGAHPKGPAQVHSEAEDISLDLLIERNPELLSPEIQHFFNGKFPYLLKVLDVRKMLSIQAHPTKEKAEIGFSKENELGIPVTAPHRNYRDDNHKPEVMIALTEFWLLHGFRKKTEIRHLVDSHPIFQPFESAFQNDDIRSLYKTIMETPQGQVDAILSPYIVSLREQAQQKKLSKNQPEFWAARAVQDIEDETGLDRGIFSIFLLNLVRLDIGQGIFQGAGIPHAYLEGVNVELMANSDNVFRGGLTYKHVDVPELLESLIFDEITPSILTGEISSKTETNFPVPVPDFALSRIHLTKELVHQGRSASPEIFILLSGSVIVNGQKQYQKGESFMALPGITYEIRGLAEQNILFRAYVDPVILSKFRQPRQNISTSLEGA